MIPIRLALQNYLATRQLMQGSPYPHVSCSCAFCNVVRAGDLLFQAVELQERIRAGGPRELLDDDRRRGS